MDAADKRPLHRKGSLNRVGMNENIINKAVKESIRKIIKEEIDTGQVPAANESTDRIQDIVSESIKKVLNEKKN